VLDRAVDLIELLLRRWHGACPTAVPRSWGSSGWSHARVESTSLGSRQAAQSDRGFTASVIDDG